MLLVQKKPRPCPKIINETTRLFSDLADLDFEPSYNDHVYFQYLSNNKNDISLLGAYHPEEIYLKYIIRVGGKGFTVVNHPSEVYGIPDAHECIDGNLPLRLVLDIDVRQNPDSMNPELSFLDKYKITREDLLSRILIACADIIYSNSKHLVPLNAFTLTSSFNADKCSWHIIYPHTCFIDYRDLKGFVEKVANRVGKLYSEFIDIGLYKSRFSLQLLGLAKEDRFNLNGMLLKSGHGPFLLKSQEKGAFQPIEDETALSKGADFVTAKYKWLEVGSIKKGFINFQAKSYEACPICDIRHEKDQLYGFLQSDGCFILRCYWQKQYKPDHKGLTFGEISTLQDIIKPKDRLIQKIVDRVANAIAKPRPLVELSGKVINVKKLKDAPESYPDFLSSEKTTTLIRSSPATWKTTTLREIIMALKDKVHDISSLPCFIWISYRKSLSNESKAKLDELKASGFRICNYQNMQGELSINEWDIIIVQVESLFRIEFTARPFVAILDESNAIMRQMSSSTNAQESESAMRDVLRSVRHILAMDAFANKSTLAFLKTYRGKDIRIIDNRYQPRVDETVEILYDPNSGAEAMRIGYELLKQGKRVAFVSTGVVMARALVEKASKLVKPDNSPIRAQAEISFEVTGHFDIVIAITNITTPVHVEALAQMLYRIRDCSRRIVFVFYQKNSNELFRSPGRENI
ncbi:hypothetical protein RclHR1_02400003 [Rhizophagus clarus]|uniref:Replication origin-binding protein domain-containing protein n=1 Tax=Rhizophagus clarus TaxID=94130 RepID=A0A2Z6QWQ2_9GLOM|nr:hypothetical protein RclHR1_02400003 [Rhizophagus clarus]